MIRKFICWLVKVKSPEGCNLALTKPGVVLIFQTSKAFLCFLICLLNCDYKIGAEAIANRLKKVIPKLVNSDQTGFIKGWFIGENIRLIDSVINFAAAKNIPGLLLFLDFEKAFDSLNWSFIQRTFKHFNFGSPMINWVKTFYNNIESCVLNNGWSSNFFKPERGVRQGCPLSPYLFILCVEVLAEKIRNTKDIKGIFVNDSEIKISQYADDTTLILDGSKSPWRFLYKYWNVSEQYLDWS